MVLTRKRLLLIGFVLILLLGIPATLYVVQQQQELRSRAERSTTLFFQPPSTQASPIVKKVDDVFTLDVVANPGNNLMASVRLEILYDPTKLATASAAPGEPPFKEDLKSFPQILAAPEYEPGRVSVTVSTGGNPTAILDSVTKVGTITFKAIADTGGVPTQVSHGPETLVASAGNTQTVTNPEIIDQTAENVLSSTSPAFILINGQTPTATPTGSPSATPTLTPTLTPTPIIATGAPGPEGPQGPQGPQGPAGQTIEITSTPTATPEASATPTLAPGSGEEPTATPTMVPSGPGETILGFGFVLTVLTVIGGILFFAL